MSRYSQKDDNFRCLAKKGACEGKVLHACSWHKAANGDLSAGISPTSPATAASESRCWACQRFQWIPERWHFFQRKWRKSRKRWGLTTWINDHYDMCFFRFVCERPVMRQNASWDWIITGADGVQLPELPWNHSKFRHFVSVKDHGL